MFVVELDWRSPVEAFAPFADEAFSFLLHGGGYCDDSGWSVIGADPARTVEWTPGVTLVDGEPRSMAPLEMVRRLYAERRVERSRRDLAPFQSGLFAVIGYDCAPLFEPAAPALASPYRIPDLSVGAYDALAVFNRRTHEAFVVGRCSSRVTALAEKIQGKAGRIAAVQGARAIGSTFSPAQYHAAVSEVVERIRAGEIFQANISQVLSAQLHDNNTAYELFCAGVAKNDEGGAANFGAYVKLNGGDIVSFSPERFFKIHHCADGFRVVAEPIKGTRPRGDDPASDRRLADELANDPKDRAENIMIADLTRNDLSRVCRDGSIREDEICALMTLPTVHHLVSRISGVLREGLGALDVLDAMFPCGSITGAPKIQAMRVIAGTEKRGRGPYCGAIGYIDDGGEADFSVAIRTMIVEPAAGATVAPPGAGAGAHAAGASLSIPVGGGITVRSDPQSEYDETLSKAAGALAALGLTKDDYR